MFNLLHRLIPFLRVRQVIPTKPETFNDGAYLAANPDVAEAGVDPWQHYWKFGRYENRPLQLPPIVHSRQHAYANTWQHYLWCGLEDVMLPRLTALAEDETAKRVERQQALWALGQWYCWKREWVLAEKFLQSLIDQAPDLPEWLAHAGVWLNYLDALRAQGKYNAAQAALDHAFANWPEVVDLKLAKANLMQPEDDPEKIDVLNGIYKEKGLCEIAWVPGSEPLFDRLQAKNQTALIDSVSAQALPCVSVIVPCFNAADVVTTALRSLKEQTWPNLDVVVVDDASTDNTVQCIHKWLAENPLPKGKTCRVHVSAGNEGAYAARNIGLALAVGEYITVHDADDWSHPEKIALQVAALQENRSCMASLSHWVRATPSLLFGRWRTDEHWTYMNVSSLMMRRQVFEQLGYWDNVKVNADTEYRHRIMRAYSAECVVEVLPGVPLALGRSTSNSLSQHSETHLITSLMGLRKQYMDAALRWHASTSSVEELYVPQNPVERPFLAPKAMLREQKTARFCHPIDELQQHPSFDPVAYLKETPELLDRVVDPAAHAFNARGQTKP